VSSSLITQGQAVLSPLSPSHTPFPTNACAVAPAPPPLASHGQVAFLPFTPDTMESIVKLHMDQLGQQLVMDGTRWQQV
jgi:hypothetical protein